ncbi:MAG: hypothetical protein H6760_04770 [Candidatus Nomurabacteria bacterium]|nr:MAG: hypothetical protein H6760_04770 [Candidatus Nomurabacteria bacterium]
MSRQETCPRCVKKNVYGAPRLRITTGITWLCYIALFTALLCLAIFLGEPSSFKKSIVLMFIIVNAATLLGAAHDLLIPKRVWIWRDRGDSVHIHKEAPTLPDFDFCGFKHPLVMAWINRPWRRADLSWGADTSGMCLPEVTMSWTRKRPYFIVTYHQLGTITQTIRIRITEPSTMLDTLNWIRFAPNPFNFQAHLESLDNERRVSHTLHEQTEWLTWLNELVCALYVATERRRTSLGQSPHGQFVHAYLGHLLGFMRVHNITGRESPNHAVRVEDEATQIADTIASAKQEGGKHWAERAADKVWENRNRAALEPVTES